MPLSAGTRIGTYEIVAPLGQGGMGEVYRAHDARLGRDVALKILPDLFARDAERLARFEREARTLAALNHPNVAQVYGFENGALILELLEGETLRDRLKAGPIPVRKAIDIGSQIARGLAAAHDRGIIHRDLKPENVFVLPDGHVKILDFGLAAQALPTGFDAAATAAAITDPGTVMGTVGYMAPEQVRGQALDARADLFALGTVLYELLTGQRAFPGDTAAESLAAILKTDPPDPSGSRAEVGPALDRIVRHCLEKNPIERFQTARDVAFALDALSGSASTPAQAVVQMQPALHRNRLLMVATVLSTAAAIGLGVLALRPAPEPPAGVPYAASLPLPDGIRFSLAPPALRLAISPDGRRLAFVGFSDSSTGRGALFLQSLDEPLARAVAGGEDGYAPFWSPDSRTLGFSMGGVIRRVAADGGTPAVIAGAAGVGTFLDDRRLLFFSSRVGSVQELVLPATQPRDFLVSSKPGEQYAFPVALPGGRRMLFGYRNVSAPDTEGTYIANLDGSDKRLLLPNREAVNTAFANGALLYVRNGAVVAQPFDPEREVLSGEPTVVADSVALSGGGGLATAAFSVSANGTLVFEPAPAQPFSRLQWISRSGAAIATLGDDADYSNLELSPDGSRLAVSVTDSAARSRDIWIVDVTRGVRQRLTFDPSEERSAVWTRDSARVIYNSKRLNLYARASNGSGAELALQTDDRSKDPRDVSPDGRRLLFRRTGDTTGNDIWVMPLDGNGTPAAIVETPFSENYGSFSPDGRSIVYVSDESGESEVYVLSLEDAGGKARISTAGGTFPRWRRDGREIVYLDPNQQIMSVPVSGVGQTFRAEAARPLFRIAAQSGPGVPFDVTPDGQRFIVNTELPSRGVPGFTIVVNWPALLQKP